jgi:two-component system, OmpR family, response regulator ChvI
MATILCIDDQANHLAIRRLLLETKGYTVLTATDGPTGIAVAQANAIDVVVLDYSMPIMDGEQVASILRQEHPALKIILLSGFNDIPERLLWLVDGYVRKGDSALLLLSAIAEALNGSTHKKPTSAIPSSQRIIA